MKFFHGTSSTLSTTMLKPALETGILRENRQKNCNKVFITISKPSAERYAKLAVDKFGGKPLVVEVKPIHYHQINGTEYICDHAYVRKVVS